MDTVVVILCLLVTLGSFPETESRRTLMCPNGQPPVNCFVSPCRGKWCLSNPALTCRADYCKGCNSIEWVDSNQQVQTCEQDNTTAR